MWDVGEGLLFHIYFDSKIPSLCVQIVAIIPGTKGAPHNTD